MTDLYEHLCVINIFVQHHIEELNAIVKKKRVMTQGMKVILKNQILITTKELYEKIKSTKETTKKRKNSSGDKVKGKAE